MNETTRPDGSFGVPWPTSDLGTRTPDAPTPSGGEKAPPAAVRMLNQAVHHAHDTLDRLADSAAPAVQKVGDSVSAAGDAVNAKADELRETRDEWVEGMRTTVRTRPLACVAAAVVLGVVIARLTR